MTFKKLSPAGLATLLLLLTPLTAAAHVKWFADFNFGDRPRTLTEIATPTFFALAAFSTIVIAGFVLLDRRLEHLAWYKGLNEWLMAQRQHSLLVMRIAIAAVLLILWATDNILAPELTATIPGLAWAQFVIAILLLFPQTTPFAGGGILLLFVISIFEFGLFHMLDYVHYLGIGFFLLVSQLKEARWRELGLPALFAAVGFSLCWLALEKLVYPTWGMYLLEQNPQLTLGFPPEFFLVGAAFVEFCLGYLLIIGLLERPLSLIITLVFFTTTLVFGRLEVIGHTPLHAALIVFLLNGPGTLYKPPIAIHNRLNWRTAFAAVNFVLLLAIMSVGYTASAQQQFETAVAASRHATQQIDLTGSENLPSLSLNVTNDGPSSYNLEVITEHFRFTPENTGQELVLGEGHAHLYINGQKEARLYAPWYHLGTLEP
ncbi:MAG: DoxX family membrane protein, partial [Chloroflexota bacterium]